jgi:hypothetical protein
MKDIGSSDTPAVAPTLNLLVKNVDINKPKSRPKRGAQKRMNKFRGQILFR